MTNFIIFFLNFFYRRFLLWLSFINNFDIIFYILIILFFNDLIYLLRIFNRSIFLRTRNHTLFRTRRIFLNRIRIRRMPSKFHKLKTVIHIHPLQIKLMGIIYIFFLFFFVFLNNIMLFQKNFFLMIILRYSNIIHI
jgi:hypothetical protein